MYAVHMYIYIYIYCGRRRNKRYDNTSLLTVT